MKSASEAAVEFCEQIFSAGITGSRTGMSTAVQELIICSRLEGSVSHRENTDGIGKVLDACEDALRRIVASDPGPAYHIAKGVLDEYFPPAGDPR